MLLSGIRSTARDRGSSSSPDSSSEEGVATCRGGSLSPKAIVRVGGGGSLLEPNGFLSISPLDGETSWERLGRGGAVDGGGSSSGEILVPRRTGSGGGGDENCLRLWVEESKVDSPRPGVPRGW